MGEDSLFEPLGAPERSSFEQLFSLFRSALDRLGEEHQREVSELKSEIRGLHLHSLSAMGIAGKTVVGAIDVAHGELVSDLSQQEEAGSEPGTPAAEPQTLPEIAAVVREGLHVYGANFSEEALVAHNPDAQGLLHACATFAAEGPAEAADTIKLLLDARWDPNRRDNSGETALSSAVRGAVSLRVVDALLTGRADPNALGAHGETPLLTAVRSCERPHVELLLQARASPNVADSFGESPLMEAAHMKSKSLCEILLHARADIDQANQFELTALDFSEDPAVTDLFLQERSSAPPAAAIEDPQQDRGEEGAVESEPVAASVQPGASVLSPATGLPLAGVGCELANLEQAAKLMEQAFEWEIPIDRMRSVQKGEKIKSKYFTLPCVSCRLRAHFYPKGEIEAEEQSSSLGVWPGVGVDKDMRLVVCFNGTSVVSWQGGEDGWTANMEELLDFPEPQDTVLIKIAAAAQL